MLDQRTLAALRSGLGELALKQATRRLQAGQELLPILQALRRDFSPELAGAVLEQIELRKRARGKFTQAEQLFFTRTALEQASGEVIARYRAERYCNFPDVVDLCCGIGGDALALAQVSQVKAVDVDPVRLAVAEANAAVLGLSERIRFRELDLEREAWPEAAAAFFDPDRRVEGHRGIAFADYRPRLEYLRQALPQYRGLGMKVAPGANWRDLEAWDASVEFISVQGELKEAVLWFGELRQANRVATVLPAGNSFAASTPLTDIPRGEPGAYLYDPDPSITRAGLVGNLAERLDAWQLDPEIGYLSSAAGQATPFARRYSIEDWFGFHEKRLREWLRTRQVGRITVLKRGSPIKPEDLQRRMRLSGPEHRVVVLTRWHGRPVVLVGSVA